MQKILEFLIANGPLVLFVSVFVDQLGIPVPAAPLLIAAGALAHAGLLDGPTAAAACFLAAASSHAIWFQAGRRGGARILQVVCRISLEPDACVRDTQDLFLRYGAKSLILARFIPGFGVVSIPLAGMSGMRLGELLAYDGIGLTLWLLGYAAIGWIFSDRLEAAADHVLDFGIGLGAIAVGGLAIYLAVKLIRRYQLLREVRMARITPVQLRQRMIDGEPVTIVDLRSTIALRSDPRVIAGALRIDPEELGDRHHELPRAAEIILYCS